MVFNFVADCSKCLTCKKGGLFSRPRGEVSEKSTNDELTKLMRNGVAIGDPKKAGLLSTWCKASDMFPQCEHEVDIGLKCVFNRDSCYVVGIESETASVYLLSKRPQEQAATGSESCAKRPEFQAVYLPYIINGDSYTKLVHSSPLGFSLMSSADAICLWQLLPVKVVIRLLYTLIETSTIPRLRIFKRRKNRLTRY